MANLRQSSTGLPMVVWVSERGHAQHDARVKVQMSHSHRMDAYNTASVEVRPVPRLVEGHLTTPDWRAVEQWINLNRDALLAYWEGTIDTGELMRTLVTI